jgi:hypothetical protein
MSDYIAKKMDLSSYFFKGENIHKNDFGSLSFNQWPLALAVNGDGVVKLVYLLGNDG